MGTRSRNSLEAAPAAVARFVVTAARVLLGVSLFYLHYRILDRAIPRVQAQESTPARVEQQTSRRKVIGGLSLAASLITVLTPIYLAVKLLWFPVLAPASSSSEAQVRGEPSSYELQRLNQEQRSQNARVEELKRAAKYLAADAEGGDFMLVDHDITLEDRRRYLHARDLLVEALELAPEDPEVHGSLGAVYYVMQQWDQAKPHLERCVAHLEESAAAICFQQLGRIAQEAGNLNLAHIYYEEARRMAPDSVALLATIAADTDDTLGFWQALHADPASASHVLEAAIEQNDPSLGCVTRDQARRLPMLLVELADPCRAKETAPELLRIFENIGCEGSPFHGRTDQIIESLRDIQQLDISFACNHFHRPIVG